MKITLEKYYELQANPSSKEEYERVLKELSNEIESKDFFKVKGKTHPKRNELHENIIKEYLKDYEPLKGTPPTLHFITGSIGSGKTSVKDAIVEGIIVKGTNIKPAESYICINLDDIKNQLEEYRILKKINPEEAASFVQAESATIAGKLFKKSIQKKLSIIYEKNIVRGANKQLQAIEELKKARKKGYFIDICVVFVDSYETAQEGVDERAEQFRRHVPKELVKETFDNLFHHLKEVVQTKHVDTICFFDNHLDSLPLIPIGFFIANRHLNFLSSFKGLWHGVTHKIETGSLTLFKGPWRLLDKHSKESFKKAFPFNN